MLTVYFLVIVFEGSNGFGVTHIPQTKEQCEVNARNINSNAVKLKHYGGHEQTATCIVGALTKWLDSIFVNGLGIAV